MVDFNLRNVQIDLENGIFVVNDINLGNEPITKMEIKFDGKWTLSAEIRLFDLNIKDTKELNPHMFID